MGRPLTPTASPRGRLLRRVRKVLGLTQRGLSNALRVTPSTLGAWERGDSRMPDSRLDSLLLLVMDADHDPVWTPKLLHAIREERGR